MPIQMWREICLELAAYARESAIERDRGVPMTQVLRRLEARAPRNEGEELMVEVMRQSLIDTYRSAGRAPPQIEADTYGRCVAARARRGA
jgi:hypothetical protein